MGGAFIFACYVTTCHNKERCSHSQGTTWCLSTHIPRTFPFLRGFYLLSISYSWTALPGTDHQRMNFLWGRTFHETWSVAKKMLGGNNGFSNEHNTGDIQSITSTVRSAMWFRAGQWETSQKNWYPHKTPGGGNLNTPLWLGRGRIKLS